MTSECTRKAPTTPFVSVSADAMRKDEFRTDDEKDAWQQGYISSIEVLTDLHQDLPENLHGALCAGWWCAFEDATKRRR